MWIEEKKLINKTVYDNCLAHFNLLGCGIRSKDIFYFLAQEDYTQSHRWKHLKEAPDDDAPRIVNYRQRWRVAGEKSDRSVLISVADAKLAVTVHEELERARCEGTPTGPDGWPLGSVRPTKSPSRSPFAVP